MNPHTDLHTGSDDSQTAYAFELLQLMTPFLVIIAMQGAVEYKAEVLLTRCICVNRLHSLL